MRYDFDTVIDRHNTDCAKWDAAPKIFGGEDILPMWVADMDFPIAKPITEALRKRTEHEIYGYNLKSWPSLTDAIIKRIYRKYGWEISPEWIVLIPGVVAALYAAAKAFTRPGDSIIHQGPVYYPFWSAIKDNGCHVANNQLVQNGGRYEIDYDDLESHFETKVGLGTTASRVRMMIMCNPHNPVGRVWNREELTRVGEVVQKRNAIMVVDEIHCELLMKNATHIPFGSISREFELNSITCMAASKTFNLAGLEASIIIIPDKQKRRAFNEARAGIMSGVNTFGLIALEAAYNHGDEWLTQLLEYLQKNLDYLVDYFREKIPEILVVKPEGTYLVWLDCRGLGLDDVALRALMREKAKIGLDDGYLFGPGGSGFQRLNFACPRATLREALRRIEQAIREARTN